MGQHKGQTGNPKGRPKGTPNKVTTDLRTWIGSLINSNREQLETDIKTLAPKERWTVIEKLLQYAVPRIQSVESNTNDNNRAIDEELMEEIIKNSLAK